MLSGSGKRAIRLSAYATDQSFGLVSAAGAIPPSCSAATATATGIQVGLVAIPVLVYARARQSVLAMVTRSGSESEPTSWRDSSGLPPRIKGRNPGAS